MNYLDLIFGIVFLWSAYRGFSKGLIYQAATLGALILGIWGSVKFSGFTASLLVTRIEVSDKVIAIISFALTFIAIVIGVHFLAKLIEKLVKAIALGFVNRIFGMLFSMLKTILIISVLLMFINTLNQRVQFLPKEQTEQSLLYKPLSNVAPLIFPFLKQNFNYFKKERQGTEEEEEFYTKNQL